MTKPTYRGEISTITIQVSGPNYDARKSVAADVVEAVREAVDQVEGYVTTVDGERSVTLHVEHNDHARGQIAVGGVTL